MEKATKQPFLFQIVRHQYELAWIGIFLFLFIAGVRFDWLLSLVTAITMVCSMLLLNYFIKSVLIKYLLRPHRQIYYYLVSFFLIYLMIYVTVHVEYFIVDFLDRKGMITIPAEISPIHRMYPFLKTAFLLLSTFTITTVSYLLGKTKAADKVNTALKNEKLDMELRYLKAQINPHFLFNALNNIYSLVYTNDENAAESILKLSEMLRYVTDECQAEKISLAKEIKYIDNYIDFQLMRMENHPNIQFNKEIRNPEFKLPPMILQPMIENSFKHSRLENYKDGYIYISLIQNEKELVFIVENSQAKTMISNIRERGGIGVQNVEKRLDLAYGKNYSLKIENNSQFYKVKLHIDLQA